MEKLKIHYKKALEMLIKGEKVLQDEINFNNEQIHIKDVSLFNMNSIRVPERLIFYDDENIDCSDIP